MKTTHKPSCTITLKNWGGHKKIRITGAPLHLNIEHPIDRVFTWDGYQGFPFRRPTEVKVVFGIGTEKMRMWP